MQHLTERCGEVVLCEAGTQADLTQHINRASFPIDTELFSGRCRVYVEGLPGAADLHGQAAHTQTIQQANTHCCLRC